MPTPEIVGIPGVALLLLALIVAVGLFGRRVYYLFRLLRLGQPEDRLGNVGERIKAFFAFVIGQRRLFKDPVPGLMHAFIFWGFLIVSLGTLEMIGKGLFQGFSLPLLGDNPLFLLLLDTIEVVVAAAVLLAIYRRLITRPDRLTLSPEGLIILVLILSLMITDFLADGFHLAATGTPSPWSPVGGFLAGVFQGTGRDAQELWYGIFWWAHLLILLAFLVYLPFSKHLHILTSAFNVFLRSLRPKGAMVPIDIENSEVFGVSKIDAFSWKHLLDTYTCTECGRCQAACPAYLSGKPLSPKEVILDLKDHLFDRGPALLQGKAEDSDHPSYGRMVGEVIKEETLWACTSCRACEEECPLFIEQLTKILEMRRHLVLMESSFPPELKGAFKGMESSGNVYQMAPTARGDWAKGLGVKFLSEDSNIDYLYWVGCAGSYDQRNNQVAVALVKILQAAGVSFGILGPEEKCTGDPARRIGNEYLFQMLAQENIEVLKGYGVKKILTQCPHCFNTLKNEYPQFGGNFEVIHHTQLIADLLAQGRIRPQQDVMARAVYHDSCYLGRYNDVYDAPRKILDAIPGLQRMEMDRHREKGFCCGAGGGHAFMEETIGRRVNHMRVEQALERKPDTLVSACPFCLTMFEDGKKAKGVEETLKTMDVAEIVSLGL